MRYYKHIVRSDPRTLKGMPTEALCKMAKANLDTKKASAFERLVKKVEVP